MGKWGNQGRQIGKIEVYHRIILSYIDIFLVFDRHSFGSLVKSWNIKDSCYAKLLEIFLFLCFLGFLVRESKGGCC